MTRPLVRLVSTSLLAALSLACSSIQDAGTADRGSGFDRTAPPAPSADVSANAGLAALCAAADLPVRTPAELAVMSTAITDALGKLEPAAHSPQLQAVVRAAGELLVAAQAQVAFASVDPALVASFRSLVEQRSGTAAAARTRLAKACGKRVPG